MNAISTGPILDINNIDGNLWMGAIPPRGKILSNKGFDIVVLCAAEWQNYDSYTDVTPVLCPLIDTLDSDAFDDSINDIIETATHLASSLESGKKILVTCMAGVNRSGLITALTLHYHTLLPMKWCINRIKSRRQGALNNTHFVDMLLTRLETKNEE